MARRDAILSGVPSLSKAAAVVRSAEPPAHLSDVAADLWRDLMAEMGPLGCLVTTDLHALSQLCEAYADWIEAKDILDEIGNGGYYEVKGVWRVHPAFYAASDADRRLRGWLSEFSLSPTARLRWDAKTRPTVTDAEPEPEPIDLSALSPEDRADLQRMIERKMADEQREAEGE